MITLKYEQCGFTIEGSVQNVQKEWQTVSDTEHPDSGLHCLPRPVYLKLRMINVKNDLRSTSTAVVELHFFLSVTASAKLQVFGGTKPGKKSKCFSNFKMQLKRPFVCRVLSIYCCNICIYYLLDCVKRIWYLQHMRAAKVQASLRIRTVSPEPSLLAHTSSESRGTFRQKARSLAPLNGWACAVKICHDGMFEDTNSLDGAHIFLTDFYSLHYLA